MKGLITADWQVEWEILDICTKAWQKAIQICKEKKLHWIFIVGDAKHKYNPLDVRVIKWWQWAIAYAIQNKIGVYFLLGNHDRDGLYSDEKNWFPILRKAGGICIDKPEVMDMGNGKLMLLPFMSSIGRLKHEAKKLSRQANPEKDILLFHADIKNAKYNKLGEKSNAKLSVSDLFPSRFKWCIGGHIHLPQKISENIYYVGSPFATDWGEANQRKRFLAIVRDRLLSEDTELPHWYDERWPGFPTRNRIRAGDRIRIYIKCRTSADYGRIIEKARVDAERRYPGAHIFVVPKFDSGATEGVTGFEIGDRDERKIAKYVEETVPSHVNEKQAEAYLNYQLKKVSDKKRSGSHLYFQKAEAKNFLCFKELKFDFRQEGLTVIQGVNKDARGSNGSGKTSTLQTIPVALFGRTFKGQKFDAWARRNSNSSSSVKVWFKDSRGKQIVVKRGRRPVELRLTINGIDESSGNKHTDKGATQELIEAVSGFTWETLANSVYIDQTITRAFLSGRDKARSDVLARFQNIERFERALKLVRRDLANTKEKMIELDSDLSNTQERIQECKDEMRQEENRSRTIYKDLYSKFKQAEKDWVQAKKELKEKGFESEEKRRRISTKIGFINERITAKERQLHQLEVEKIDLAQKIHRVSKLKDTCPTCMQPVRIIKIGQMKERWQGRIKEIIHAIEALKPFVQKLRAHSQWMEGRYDHLAIEVKELEFKTKEKESKADSIYQQIREQKKESDTLGRLKKKIGNLRRKKNIFKKYLGDLRKNRMPLLEYSEKAFSRDGIPAFLNMQLAPVLNKSAEYYSGLFNDNTIQVRFEVEEGDLIPKILNAAGGETIDDQSTGEKAMAGLVTSFALREIAPATNLLILDEPGEGLDVQNAKQFAKAIVKLKDKFKTILLTTHNSAILQELASERIVTVIKQKGVSRVQ